MNVQTFLETHFPTVKLTSSLTEQWNEGIHFSLGQGMYQFKDNGELDPAYFKTVSQQAYTLFNELVDEGDHLFLVAHLYKAKDQEKRLRKTKVFHTYVKNRQELKHVRVKTEPYPYEIDDGKSYEMQQFSLRCKRGDLRMKPLLQAICHEDFPSLKPRLEGYVTGYPDVWFINETKKRIFHLYDDRGCEIIAHDEQEIRTLYHKYREWLDPYE
ncbi:hypothetical protein JOC54_003086 [Alkalihalobacillus xiaoxiensis]|uniref:DUF3885 domain-containing protein n=1 Tax=Shouchella xiaoxiensis TaxID=766895 RepID=A0ABS2SX82_9BACI|nr:DUF3885 domain-containing protein [Shouchella xiaoxiensis]MBM7839806.1 hypothetical protein [Shouchella xiaoxiensis]